MTCFEDENLVDFMAESKLANEVGSVIVVGHTPVAIQNNNLRVKCCVHQLESKMHDILKKSPEGKQKLKNAMDARVTAIENP